MLESGVWKNKLGGDYIHQYQYVVQHDQTQQHNATNASLHHYDHGCELREDNYSLLLRLQSHVISKRLLV